MIAFFIILMILLLLILFPVMGATDLHFHRKEDNKRIRVACVGDSITNGALIPNCFKNSYPAKLQKLLGKEYHVENFGLNDRTLQSFADKPYEKEAEFRKSLLFMPDIVVILLGTNDTKPFNWRSEEVFYSEYNAFLEHYTGPERAPKIILCTPPWAIPAAGRIMAVTNDADPSVLPDVSAAVKRIGQERSIPVIDLYPQSEGKRELLSYDGLHPNISGAEYIAESVAEQIKGIAF